MLENVVEFTSTEVGTVMTPRTDIEGLPLSDDLSAIREFIVEAGHSRIPVYGESLDDIRGILYVKDLVAYLGTEADDFALTRVLRQPIRIPETKPVKDLLRDFQRSEVHLAIVVDEYGGDQRSGDDRGRPGGDRGRDPGRARFGGGASSGGREVDPGRWVMDGRYQIYDLNELLGTSLPEDDDFDTVAGFVLERLGRVPGIDESFQVAGLRFQILEATPTRIERLQIERRSEDEPSEGMDDSSPESGTAQAG